MSAEEGTPRDFQAYELTVDMLEDLLVTAGAAPNEHSAEIRKTAGALVYKIGSRLTAKPQGEASDVIVDEWIARAVAESDDKNHEDLCHCASWPESCVTYAERRPWSHDAEFVARAALRAAGVTVEDQRHENEDYIRSAEKEIARLTVENARQLAVIERVRIYAADRAHYGRGGREVGSARIASDLQEILNPRRMDEQS